METLLERLRRAAVQAMDLRVTSKCINENCNLKITGTLEDENLKNIEPSIMMANFPSIMSKSSSLENSDPINDNLLKENVLSYNNVFPCTNERPIAQINRCIEKDTTSSVAPQLDFPPKLIGSYNEFISIEPSLCQNQNISNSSEVIPIISHYSGSYVENSRSEPNKTKVEWDDTLSNRNMKTLAGFNSSLKQNNSQYKKPGIESSSTREIHFKSMGIFREVDKLNESGSAPPEMSSQLITKHFDCSLCPFKAVNHYSYLAHCQKHETQRQNNISDATYQCSVCSQCFTLKVALLNHVRFKHKNKVHLYEQVKESLCKANQFVLREKQDGSKIFCCSHCPFSSKYSSSLMVHRRIHTDEKPYWCAACPERFRNKASQLYHMRSQHKSNYKLCQVDKRSRNVIINGYTDSGYCCEDCDFRTRSLHVYIEHKASHNCDGEIDEKNQNNTQMNNNMQAKGSNEIPNISDKTMEETNVQINRPLLSTFRKSLPNKLSALDLISQQIMSNSVKSNKEKADDIMQSNNSIPEKQFKCQLCEFETTFLGRFIKHNVKEHCKNKPRDKQSIPETSLDSSKATTNLNKTTSEKKILECNICLYKTSHPPSLTRHISLHTGERPYVCVDCGIGFIQKSSLQVHVAKHCPNKINNINMTKDNIEKKDIETENITESAVDNAINKSKIVESEIVQLNSGDCIQKINEDNTQKLNVSKIIPQLEDYESDSRKVYSCSYCNFQTHYYSSSIVHQRQHTGEKPFWCFKCKTRYIQRIQITKHIQTHHDNDLSLFRKDFPIRWQTKPVDLSTQTNFLVKARAFVKIGHSPLDLSNKMADKDVELLHNPMFRKKTTNISVSENHVDRKVNSTDISEKMKKSSNERSKSFEHAVVENFVEQSEELMAADSTASGLDIKAYSIQPSKNPFVKKRNSKHKFGIKNFACTVCSYNTSDSFSLWWHKRSHTKRRMYGCKTCNINYSRKNHYISHCIRVHQTMPDDITDDYQNFVQSPIKKNKNGLSKSYTASDDILLKTSHIKSKAIKAKAIDSAPKFYHCRVCSFTSKYSLTVIKKHKRLHLRPYQCALCFMTFSIYRYAVGHIERLHPEKDVTINIVNRLNEWVQRPKNNSKEQIEESNDPLQSMNESLKEMASEEAQIDSKNSEDQGIKNEISETKKKEIIQPDGQIKCFYKRRKQFFGFRRLVHKNIPLNEKLIITSSEDTTTLNIGTNNGQINCPRNNILELPLICSEEMQALQDEILKLKSENLHLYQELEKERSICKGSVKESTEKGLSSDISLQLKTLRRNVVTLLDFLVPNLNLMHKNPNIESTKVDETLVEIIKSMKIECPGIPKI